jgi:hypothetical protein
MRKTVLAAIANDQESVREQGGWDRLLSRVAQPLDFIFQRVLLFRDLRRVSYGSRMVV